MTGTGTNSVAHLYFMITLIHIRIRAHHFAGSDTNPS